MGYGGFSFSLSEDSVDEIRSFIDGYIQDMIDLMNGFQDELAAHFSSVHYMKLWKAVIGIIELYNDSVRQELKDEIYTEWEDSGESVTAFVQRMDMGEDSEEAAAEIEDILSELFEWDMDDRLGEIRADGNSGASEADFDEVKNIFAGVVKKAEEATEDMQSAAEERGEDNQVYRLLLPVLRAYGRGICSYFEDAETKLDHLEDDYLDRMAAKKDSAREPIKEPDFSVFSDLMYEGMGIAGSVGSGNSGGSPQSLPKEESVDSGMGERSKEEEPIDFGMDEKSKEEEPIDFGMDEKSKEEKPIDFGMDEKSKEEKPIDFGMDEKSKEEQPVDSGTDAAFGYGDYLPEEFNALMGLDISDDDPNYMGNYIPGGFNASLGLENFGDIDPMDRDALIAFGMTSEKLNEVRSENHILYMGMLLKRDFAPLKNDKKDILDIISYADIDDLESDLNKFDMNKCRRQLPLIPCKIFLNNRGKLLSNIQQGQQIKEKAIKKANKEIQNIMQLCKSPCSQIEKLFPELYLCKREIDKEDVAGFYSPALGHKIIVNEKYKSWIDSEQSDKPKENRLSYDGVLNMKTPVHEYLHYLSNDIDGDGVIDYTEINKIANKKDHDEAICVMKGFNEGITEMFAQDYLMDEMKNYDFENENSILKYYHNKICTKSYRYQVEIVKAIREYLKPDDKIIRDAYIKHDFSIIEEAVTAKKASESENAAFDWKKAKEIMSKIQKGSDESMKLMMDFKNMLGVVMC